MAAPEGYNALGKIGISYKGDYDSNTTYERLDAVEHNGSTYLAIKDAPDGAPRDDKLNWIYLAKGFSGDIGDSEIAFTEAENRENINTGESVKTVFGKIKKFFADLTAPAFAQMITSKDDLLATKAAGYVPDAKAVADAVSEVNGKLVSLDNVASMVINTDNNSATFKLKLAPSGTYIRYTALLVLCNQHAGFVGAYVIGVNDVGENIHKIAGENATISRNGDNVIVVFGENSIWSTGLLIAPRILVQ